MNDKVHGCRILVTGMVQGVGFRPTVAELAEECNLLGQVKNLGGVVEIIVSGENDAVEKFLYSLNLISGIDTMETEELILTEKNISNDVSKTVWQNRNGKQYVLDAKTFCIVRSEKNQEYRRILPVDLPTCDRCKSELFDPNNRRYRYPFISCTQCGPRYSIQKAVPYDRENITMDIFLMCPECEKEYKEKGNIRRHAQTIACHNCGPKLKLVTSTGNIASNERVAYNLKDTDKILSETVQALREDKIAAIKDIGGFHFAFSPYSSKAAMRLREFKDRDKKPFAVMFFDMDELKEYCEVSGKEEELLRSDARPIVLLNKKKDFAPEVCQDSDRIGAMLPCNPLQLLLLKETGPLVMTSGNRGGEPIIICDKDMEELMEQGCPDLMLTHDREILTPLDDSIYQVNGQYVQIIRRARGLVPNPIAIKRSLKQDTFAAGGDLKAVFALGKDNMVYLSQYFGDLEDVRCTNRREEAIRRMADLLAMEPKKANGDLHPSYISTKGIRIKVQHHEAHVVSVIAEHGLKGRVLGIACDGTGFGWDNRIWGSEFFLYDENNPDEIPACNKGIVAENAERMKHLGHLTPVKLLGGDAGAKDAEKALFSYMMEACERNLIAEEPVFALIDKDGQNKGTLWQMAWKQNINTVYSSSMGRLFDAAAALLDICHFNSYEGECATVLEQAAHRGKNWFWMHPDKKPEDFLTVWIQHADGMWFADGVQLLVDLWKLKDSDQFRGITEKADILAYVFHHGIVLALTCMAKQMCMEHHVDQIALSGGSFINRILLSEMTEGLKAEGFKVYTNEKVPCGDGGIALGQIYMLE